MKTFANALLTGSLFLIFFTVSISLQAKKGDQKGVEYTYTTARLSPKQFTKGYHAEKRAYRAEHDYSTRRMLKKRHGSWIQRLLSRKHNNRAY